MQRSRGKVQLATKMLVAAIGLIVATQGTRAADAIDPAVAQATGRRDGRANAVYDRFQTGRRRQASAP